mmetsp:Transcript_79421/g.230594  ORF Transcript_79421/g.230594 Transcript_79421/m.230594 type:complete len:200 (+) Transcript_79421:453-1052(+)
MSFFSTARARSFNAFSASCLLGAFSMWPEAANNEPIVPRALSWPHEHLAAVKTASALRANSMAWACSPKAHRISAMRCKAEPSASLSPRARCASTACVAALMADWGSPMPACACAIISKIAASPGLSPDRTRACNSWLAVRSPAFGFCLAACTWNAASRAAATPFARPKARKSSNASSADLCAGSSASRARSTREEATR